MTQASANGNANETASKALAKISTKTVIAEENGTVDEHTITESIVEKSIIEATRLYLESLGFAKVGRRLEMRLIHKTQSWALVKR